MENDVKTGVRQGSILSSLLIILLMDLVLKQAEKDHHSLTFVYADGSGLVAYTSAELQETLDGWSKVLTENGLKLNVTKSEVMAMCRASEELRGVYGKELKQVVFLLPRSMFDS